MASKHFDHDVLDDRDDAPLVGTITNTLHLAAQLGMDPERITARAIEHYRTETSEAAAEAMPADAQMR